MVMTPAPATPAEAPDAAAETAVVPESAVTAAVTVEPTLAAAATSVHKCQYLFLIFREGKRGGGGMRTRAEAVSGRDDGGWVNVGCLAHRN